MDAKKGNVFEILNGNRQFIVPVYQRYYSWEKTQCERLWNDIVEMQLSKKNSHFVGAIVNIAEEAMPTGVQKFMVIDGQQRLTTLTILLIALRDYSREHSEDQTINARRIDEMLLKNVYEYNDEKYKLILTETDKLFLINLVEDKLNKTKGKSRIIYSYNYFKRQIESNILSAKEIYESIGKLQIVNITLDRFYDDPQAIFESLNSTGKELSESDLIRNYILMELENKEQLHIYNNLWRPMELLFEYDKQETLMDKFFRDYLTMKLKRIPNINNVYVEFKNYKKNYNITSIEDLCIDLYENAKNYTDILFARSEDPKMVSCFEDIKNLKMDVVYPFLLRVFQDYKLNSITDEDFIEIMNICISYVLRRSICGLATNSLNKTFAMLINNIDPDNYLNSLKVFFVTTKDYKMFPDDEAFKADFKIKDIYNLRNRNFILNHLENFQNKGPINISNYTIEHIMPQNENLNKEWINCLGPDWEEIHQKYLNTIGNLTLTAYNSEMSDRSFKEKLNMRGGFKESALRINSDLVKLNTWNESLIIERANLLADEAVNIWKFPEVDGSEIAKYAKSSKKNNEYDLDHYNFSEITRQLYEELNNKIMNLSSSIKREYKKLYIAYKLETNFVDIVVMKSKLCLTLNMKFNQILDPNNICKDVSNKGRWGNGDVEITLKKEEDINKVLEIIEQSLDLQMD
ncbi:MAG: GmrSD restriction endonuclease domain-containing protein [Sphaerochaeta sp.]